MHLPVKWIQPKYLLENSLRAIQTYWEMLQPGHLPSEHALERMERSGTGEKIPAADACFMQHPFDILETSRQSYRNIT